MSSLSLLAKLVIMLLIAKLVIMLLIAETLRRRDEEQTALLGALRTWHQQLRAT